MARMVEVMMFGSTVCWMQVYDLESTGGIGKEVVRAGGSFEVTRQVIPKGKFSHGKK